MAPMEQVYGLDNVLRKLCKSLINSAIWQPLWDVETIIPCVRVGNWNPAKGRDTQVKSRSMYHQWPQVDIGATENPDKNWILYRGKAGQGSSCYGYKQTDNGSNWAWETNSWHGNRQGRVITIRGAWQTDSKVTPPLSDSFPGVWVGPMSCF